jgi:hypothetical protein
MTIEDTWWPMKLLLSYTHSSSEQNVKHFAAALKMFLYHHSFYYISEYLEYKESKWYLQM